MHRPPPPWRRPDVYPSAETPERTCPRGLSRPLDASFQDECVEKLGQGLQRGTSTIVAVVEHRWVPLGASSTSQADRRRMVLKACTECSSQAPLVSLIIQTRSLRCCKRTLVSGMLSACAPWSWRPAGMWLRAFQRLRRQTIFRRACWPFGIGRPASLRSPACTCSRATIPAQHRAQRAGRGPRQQRGAPGGRRPTERPTCCS
jgi:hypothetical protein